MTSVANPPSPVGPTFGEDAPGGSSRFVGPTGPVRCLRSSANESGLGPVVERDGDSVAVLIAHLWQGALVEPRDRD